MFKIQLRFQVKIDQKTYIQKMNDPSFHKNINPNLTEVRLISGSTINEKGAKYVDVYIMHGKEYLREINVLESELSGKNITKATDQFSEIIIKQINSWDDDLLTATIEFEWHLKKLYHRIFEPLIAENVKTATLQNMQKMVDILADGKLKSVKILRTRVWGLPIKLAVTLLIFLFFLLINFAVAEKWESFYSPADEESAC